MPLRIFIDFDYDGTLAPNFTGPNADISQWVQEASIQLGAESGDLAARVGVCEITVNNADRRFSPAITDYYPGKLRPGKPIKVEWIEGMSAYPLFRGFLQAITPLPDRYGERRSVLRCIDWIGVLAAAQLELPLREAVRSDQLLRDVVNYALNAPAASGRFDFNGNPGNNDTVTINGTTYTFKTAISLPNDVLIGADRYLTADHLLAAINGWDGAGTTYHLSTTRPAFIRAAYTDSTFRAVIDDDPVRYYRMGESGGSTATDLGSNAAHGTYSGVTLGVSGALTNDPDSAVSLDGVDDYVTLPTLDLKHRSFSIEAWIKPSSSPPAQQAIFGCFSALTTRQELDLFVYSDGSVQLSFYGGEVVTAAAGTVLFGAGWYHLVATHDASTGETNLYVNGALSASDMLGDFEGDNPTLSIGVTLPVFGPFKGAIDDLALYLRALDATEIAAHFASFSAPFGLTLTSTLKGSIGNSFTFSDSSTAISSSGVNLSGGVDLPVSQSSYQTGTQTFDFAGDEWTAQRTTALDAAREIAYSEFGRLYVNRGGTLTFESGEAKFKDGILTPALTVGAANEIVELVGAESDSDIHNSVRVEFTPRSTSSTGVVARINASVKVPGKWGALNSDPNLNIIVRPDGGQTVVSLPFTDPDTGQPIGAKDLILPPEPVTDWTANERNDGLGVEYTTYTPPQLFFTVAQKASGVDVYIRNIALGPLYIRKLQIRGTRITRYDRQAAVREDVASITRYGRRIRTVTLPLLSDANTAAALAEYLIGRYAGSTYRVRSATIRNLHTLAGVNVFSIEIGSAVALSEYQTTFSNPVPKLRVSGIDYHFKVGGEFSVRWHLEAIDDINYGVYDASASQYDLSQYGV
ncbi:MAG: LamG domain-containing protein [Anaerolineae bacterium]|nr:LamG domain-containing protein [Anaerolineae bacterium]